jgi:dihydroxyacetone kinase
MYKETKWDIKPTVIYSGVFETSLNGPGFSITLCNLTLAAQNSNSTVPEFLDLLAAHTHATSWPNPLANTSTKAARTAVPVIDIEKRAEIPAGEDINSMFPDNITSRDNFPEKIEDLASTKDRADHNS